MGRVASLPSQQARIRMRRVRTVRLCTAVPALGGCVARGPALRTAPVLYRMRRPPPESCVLYVKRVLQLQRCGCSCRLRVPQVSQVTHRRPAVRTVPWSLQLGEVAQHALHLWVQRRVA